MRILSLLELDGRREAAAAVIRGGKVLDRATLDNPLAQAKSAAAAVE